MCKRISVAALGFLTILCCGLNVAAQGTARLRIRVNVMPAVTASPVQPSQLIAPRLAGAKFSWGGEQQGHIITRNANAADLSKEWLNSSNPISEGTKVLHEGRGSSDAGFCEITINTVEFVTQ